MNRVGRLLHIAVKESRLVVGLMSGTSVDGIDAALVEITGHGDAATVKLLAFDSYPFPPELRARVFRLFNPREARVDAICQLDFLLGEVFAAAVERLLRDHATAAIDAGDHIWSLLNLELWYRTFIDNDGVQTLPAPVLRAA